jgi:diguanylate cyclase (GGDEF)-like protein
VDAVLAHVVERAAYAVNARAFVLAAQLEPGEPPAVHAQGLPPDRAGDVAAALLGDSALPSQDHVIAAPVRSGARSYGILAALAGAPFIPAEQELLQAYAALAAASLDAVVARRETEDRRRTAEILLEFAEDVGAARRGADVVRAATRALRTLSLADVACVLLTDPDGRLRLADATGFGADELARLGDVALDPAVLPELARLLSSPHAAALVDARDDGPWLDGLLRTVGVRQAGLVGLRCQDHVHGVGLVGWRTPVTSPSATERAVQRLTGAGIQTTTGLDKTELLRQVQLQARTDPLTGLTNRRRFVEILGEEHARVTSERRAAGLLFLDLDGFKQVNDGLGHAAGDALLVDVARRIAACLDPDDTLARLGGDEFTVLSPAVSTDDDLVALAERVLEATDAPCQVEGQTVVVRPSVGAALVRPGGEAGEALRAADEAMYRAKAAGGGRVVLAERSPAV